MERSQQNGSGRRRRWHRLVHALAKRVIVTTIVAGIAPVVTYLVVQPHVGSTAVALAIAFALPVAWAGLNALWHRSLDLDGMLTIGAYGLGLVFAVLSGGSALPLKLHSAAETGAVGVACLGSVVLRRPLVLIALRILRSGKRRGAWRRAFAEPALGPTFSVITALVGVGLLIEAASQVALALLVPTVVFVAVSLPARFVIYGGEAGMFLALRGRGGRTVRAPGPKGAPS